MEWNVEAKNIVIEYVREYGINKTSRLLRCPSSTIGVIAKGQSALPANKDIYSLDRRKAIALQAVETQNIRRTSIKTDVPRSTIQVWIKKFFTEEEVKQYSDLLKSRIIGCHMAGKTPTEISKEFEIPRRTVRNWIAWYKEGKISHTHHWVLPPPNGPFSIGECKFCKEQTVMRNSIEGATHWTMAKDKEAHNQELQEILAEAKRQLIT